MSARVPARGSDPAAVLARLRELRSRDAPTHGGHLFSYVYDSGLPELDRLASAAAELARPLNGLDPTTFPSIAAMEHDLVAFARRALGGDTRSPRGPIVGSVTSGGTESCLLAVKTARDLWRRAGQAGRAGRSGSSSRASSSSSAGRDSLHARPRLVAPATAHAAFRKAAQLFDLEWDPVPCEPDGSVRASEMIRRLGPDVALVVVSAPAYPSGAFDPIASVSEAAETRGIPCHVDACFGGLIMPWWPGAPAWDFRLPGVTSISADLHKFGYAPKGVSVLLHRGRVRHRAQFFATTDWPGYPVVNPTLLGSRSAAPLAAAWAITQHLGAEGFRELTASCVRSTRRIVDAVSGIRGITVQGDPVGPAIALVTDESVPVSERVDPHHLADELALAGFTIQHQPGLLQANGVRLPHTAHLTVTPVTERTLPDLLAALPAAADSVRGVPRARARVALTALRALGYGGRSANGSGSGAGNGSGNRAGNRSRSEVRVPGPQAAWLILRLAGAGASAGSVARVGTGSRAGGQGRASVQNHADRQGSADRQSRTAQPRAALPGRLAPLMSLAEQLPAPVAEALLTELLARTSE